jgi:hypothetical protein
MDKYKPGIHKNQPNYFSKNMDHSTIRPVVSKVSKFNDPLTSHASRLTVVNRESSIVSNAPMFDDPLTSHASRLTISNSPFTIHHSQ